MRTYRHNRDSALRAGPELCDRCREFTPKHVVTSYPSWVDEYRQLVCDDCLPRAVKQLLDGRIEYRVGAFSAE